MEEQEAMAIKLIERAMEARQNSYSPYSNFMVGSAILTSDERIFSGCNVENAGYGDSICAERNAALQAVAAGSRLFKAVAIIGFPRDMADVFSRTYAFPCGSCRQVLREFASKDMIVYVAKSTSDYMTFKFSDLLPHSFGPDHLG